jgi:hypothetical protein
MTLVLDEIRKPLSVFAQHSDSQCYIKSIRNLGDAWRRLSDKPLEECDKNTIVLETNFGLNIKFTPDKVEMSVAGPTESTESVESQESPVSTQADKTSQESSIPTTATTVQLPSISTDPNMTTTRPRRYRIAYDWGTEHLWRDFDDLEPEDDGVTYIDVDELLGQDSFPPSVIDLYVTWSDTYNDTFKTRLADTGDYNRTLFATTSERVAWYVAGYFLAWRIAMAPEVDSIEYPGADKKFLLQKDKGLETQFTKEFFEIMCDYAKNGPDYHD